MTDVDFTRDMTAEEIAAAQEAGALATEQLSGQSLLKGLKVGEQLLFGRLLVLKKYGLNAPRGQPYGMYFAAWKAQFGFPIRFNSLDDEKEAKAYFDDAIVCARNRPLAEQIITELGPKWRANNGVSALSRRIRDILRDREKKAANDEEVDDKPKRKSQSEIIDDLRAEAHQLRMDLMGEKRAHETTKRERNDAYVNPLMVWQTNAEDAAIRLFHDNAARAQAIMRALMSLMPDDAAVAAAELASRVGDGVLRKEARREARKAVQAAAGRQRRQS
jgi:hypothetical protein